MKKDEFIRRERSYDLFQNGNYVSSFSSYADIDEFLSGVYDDLQWRYPEENRRTDAMNGMKYFVVTAERCRFGRDGR